MKYAGQVKVLLMSLVLAPASFLLGWFLMAISIHSGGVLMMIGFFLAPGMLVFIILPEFHEMYIGCAAQFVLFLVIGQLYLRYGQRWRSWRRALEDKWLGQKWDEWLNRK
jgi:hypothetical protein